MGIIALSYLGVNSNKIDDWSAFAINKLGMQKVDKTSKSLLFRMDDQKQRFCVTGDDGDCLSYLGWEVENKDDLKYFAEKTCCNVISENLPGIQWQTHAETI